jgi:DNA-binding MarR family transcriptional regulator
MPKAQNFTADVADEMKLSKVTVSRLAKQMIKAGFSEIVTRRF